MVKSRSEMLLSIIIVSYNTASLTLQTLKTTVADIKGSSVLQGNVEILVADNNSNDDSRALIKKFFDTISPSVIPRTKLLRNSENLGFAKANNQAIKISQGKYVLLLNSDTLVQPGALEIMVKTFEQYNSNDTQRLGILASTLLNADSSLQRQGGSLPSLKTLMAQFLFFDDIPFFGRFFRSTQETGKNQQTQTNTVDLRFMGWVGGTAMMFRRETLAEIGLLDPNIFMYGEDMEICIRAEKHHWLRAIATKAKIIHLGSASSSSANAIIGELQGYLYIWSKHKPMWQIGLVRSILRIGILLRLLLFGTMARNPAKYRAYQKAWGLL